MTISSGVLGVCSGSGISKGGGGGVTLRGVSEGNDKSTNGPSGLDVYAVTGGDCINDDSVDCVTVGDDCGGSNSNRGGKVKDLKKGGGIPEVGSGLGSRDTDERVRRSVCGTLLGVFLPPWPRPVINRWKNRRD